MGISDSSSSSSSSSYNSSSNSLSDLIGAFYQLSKLFENKGHYGWENAIKEKLRLEQMTNQNLEKQINEKYGLSMDKFAQALGDEELFKEIFLLPNYKPDRILKEIEEELKQAKEFNDLGCPYSEAELKEAIKRINERKSKLSEHKFELILTECKASDYKNILFKNLVNSVYKFGSLHSALSLDGTVIEWGRGPCGSSLVCPTMDIKRFLFAFEIKAREDKGFFAMIGEKISSAIRSILDYFSGGAYGRWSVGRANEKKLDKIAKICVMFNRTRYYNPAILNCQHFVEALLKAIETDFTFDGNVGYIIDKLKRNGMVNFYFNGREFKTRKELDDYVKTINFSGLSRNDKKLLICYKNTFDIYLMNDKNNENYKTTDEARNYWNELIRKENFCD